MWKQKTADVNQRKLASARKWGCYPLVPEVSFSPLRDSASPLNSVAPNEKKILWHPASRSLLSTNAAKPSDMLSMSTTVAPQACPQGLTIVLILGPELSTLGDPPTIFKGKQESSLVDITTTHTLSPCFIPTYITVEEKNITERHSRLTDHQKTSLHLTQLWVKYILS